jgi:hypothetical protein
MRPHDRDYPSTASETFTPERLAQFDLWEALHSFAWRICTDPSPSVMDKLFLIHEITKPEYRAHPRDAVVALRRIKDEHSNNLSYRNHIDNALSAFMVYADTIAPEKAERPKPALIAVNLGGDERF